MKFPEMPPPQPLPSIEEMKAIAREHATRGRVPSWSTEGHLLSHALLPGEDYSTWEPMIKNGRFAGWFDPTRQSG